MLNRVRQFWQLLEGERLRYTAAMGALLLVVVFGYMVPLVGAPVIDFVFPSKDAGPEKNPLNRMILEPMIEWMGADRLRENLWIPAAVMIVFAGLSGLFMYLRNRWAEVSAERIARRLRDRLYSHLQRLPCSYFDKADTGDLVQRCTSDVETLRMFLGSQVVMIGRPVVMCLLAIPLLLSLHLRLGLLSMAVVPVIVVYSIVFFLKARATFKRQDEAEGAMTSRIQENLTGIRVVRAFARHEFEFDRFSEASREYRDRGFDLTKVMALFYPTSDLLCMVQLCAVLMAGGYLMQQGTIGAGTFFLFYFLVMQLLWPIRHMGRILAEAGKALVAMDRQWAILGEAEESDTDDDSSSAVAQRLEGEIVFERLSFAHGDTGILKDVSFRVEPGQTLAILGPSGSGKSTLVNLLLRFYDYRDGSIRLDGRELANMNRRAVRSQIGVVMQEPFLYSRSLRDNIRLGRSVAVDDQVEEAAQMACVHDAILDFDGGYEALVGERGVTLSGGQRQRVALARAIVREPPILILDDALSAVDTRTEMLILEALRRRHGRHTTLIIAHRLSTLERADRIIVLDSGRVVQSGTHEELVRAEGLYSRLWQIQTSLEDDLKSDLDAAAST